MTASAGHASTDVPAVVLVHGWAGSTAAWASLSEHWSAPSPLVAVPLPGSPGASGRFAHTVDGAVDAVREALDAYDGPAVVVGHSMGGQISLELNVDDPRIVGEVVIDPAYGASEADAVASQEWAERIDADGHVAVRSFFDEAMGAALTAGVRRQVLTDVSSTPPATIASYLRSEYLGPAAIGPADRAATLISRRRAPVLALYPSDRAATFERAHAGAGTRVEVWEGRGHYLHLEEPARFCRRLEAWVSGLRTAVLASDGGPAAGRPLRRTASTRRNR